MTTLTAMTEADRHYLGAIKIKMQQLYDEHPNDPRLREQISDEIDWIEEKLEAPPVQKTAAR